MKLRVGFEMLYEFPQPTPMIMVLGTHFTRASDVIAPDLLTTSPSVAITPYRDLFGNWCSRIGRVLIAQGRDAADVPITQTFGQNTLLNFRVWTDEIP